MLRLRVIALGVVVAAAGCASADTPALASRFIRQGTPAVDLGGLPPRTSRAAARPPLADAAIASGVSRTVHGASIETMNGELREALARLTLAPSAEHHLRVARAYRRAGILDRAYDYLTRSLDVNGPDAAVYDERARLWRDWGHPELGLADAHRAVYLSPDAAAYHNTLGTVLYRLGQAREAEVRFRHALSVNASAWYALANLCHLSLAQGRTREAIVQCQQATALRTAPPIPPTLRRKPRS